MRSANPKDSADDAIARQYRPDDRENIILPDELADPIGDDVHSPAKGIVHRYPDRVLLKITDTCHHYCRFCFRKEMVGQGAGMLADDEIDGGLAYIHSAPQVREVILTGGDPLTLSPRRLSALFEKLEAVPHLDIIRLHTRAPITSPEIITDELIALFERTRKALYLVVHTNHIQELNDAVRAGFKKLNRAGVVLLSQTVLLKDVNDNASTLEDLFRALIANRVKPYYLHHPDKAPGTGHFRVSIKQGQDILKSLQGRLSGLAIPRYVLDIPGGHGKMPIGPCYLEHGDDGAYAVEDFKGEIHRYTE
jgi:lysine 2,3-aminomutase